MNDLSSKYHSYFKKFSSKKITRNLVNQYLEINRFVYTSLFLIGVYLFIMFSNWGILGDNRYKWSLLIITISCIFIYGLIITVKLENKKFMQLSSDQRQFYLLYLIKNHLESTTKDKHKAENLWFLVREYLFELHRVIVKYREYSVFSLNDEEGKIRILKEGFENRILGNILDKKHQQEILSIINNLLMINFLLCENSYSSSSLQDREQIDKLQKDLFTKLQKINESDTKIQIFRLEWFITFFKKLNYEIIIILLVTIFVICLYYFITKLKGALCNLDTIFQLSIGTPAVVLLFLNLVKGQNKKE